jgi:hypothetical protein
VCTEPQLTVLFNMAGHFECSISRPWELHNIFLGVQHLSQFSSWWLCLGDSSFFFWWLLYLISCLQFFSLPFCKVSRWVLRYK